MTMAPKERMRRVLKHSRVDHLATQINYTLAMGRRMAAHFGVDLEELPRYFSNHLQRVELTYEDRYSEDGAVRFDWWGVGWDPEEEGYFAAFSPLSANPDLDAYPWPDPHDPALLRDAAQAIRSNPGGLFTVPNFGFALFERAWALRGFENFLMDLALDPGYAGELLDRITAIQLALVRRYLDLGVDGGYFGDDYGAQKNMLFSPASWRTLIKPRLAQLFTPFREAGLPVLLHSDGQIAPILPDLVEIGLTALNPVQPEVIDHAWLQANYGEQLAFYGGISTQTVLPHGTPEEVSRAVLDCVQRLAPAGTGLVVAPSHRLMADVPLENVAALLEAFGALR